MKKAQGGSLVETGTSSTMKKGGDGCDGCRSSSTSSSGSGNETRSARKAAAADDPNRAGEGDAGMSSAENPSVASSSSSSSSSSSPSTTRVTRSAAATAAVTTGASAATAARTAAEGDAEADAEDTLAGPAAESKESEREEEAKDGAGGQAGSRGGGGSNRAQRTCRRLALKRIRQYVGYVEEGASTPTAPDIRSGEEGSLFKEGRCLTATPSTATTAARSSTSSRARRSGSGVVEPTSAAAAGTRQRARTPASSEHSSSSSKQTSRSKGEGEPEEVVDVASEGSSPLGGGSSGTNEDALSSASPVCKSEAAAAASSCTAGSRDDAGADKICTSNELESVGMALTGTGDESSPSRTRSAEQNANDDSVERSTGNCSNSGARCPSRQPEGGVAATAAAENAGSTSSGSGRPSSSDAASDSGLRVPEDARATDEAPAPTTVSSPVPSTGVAGSAKKPLAGGTNCALVKRNSTLLRGGNTTDTDLQGHQRWQQQEQLGNQPRVEAGTFVLTGSDGVVADDDCAPAAAQETARSEKDALLFSSGPSGADAVIPSPAAVTTPPAAAALPSSMFLSAGTLPTSRTSSYAAGAVSFPASLASPTTCGYQHTANLNALMVKSVSPAGVVRRGGRNRRKRTKYDLAYRQMEQLGPFAEEAKAVDLSKVSGSSFAVELLKNPELYSYEAWSHGFAWPVGADGRRLLLRKLRGVYWSDPDYWQQRLVSEGLYRRDLFTLATVQELFKVTHLMGPAVWDFLLKCTALTHKCEALTAKDSDQTDGEDGGGAAAHASSPEALSPNAGPRPVAPSAEAGIGGRRLGTSSRGSLLPAPATDLQPYAGREGAARTNSFLGESGADAAADSEAAAAAHALAAAAGTVAEDPVGFAWLRTTAAGVTSLGPTESILGASADAGGLAPERVLLLPHAGLACAGSPVREGEEGAVKGRSASRNFLSSSRQKTSFARCAVPPAASSEPENSGLELDLSTQQMLDAVAAAVEAAAAGQASQQHPTQATSLSNRASAVDAERAPYLATNSDIAAVLAAARGFNTGYECSATSASPTSHIDGCAVPKEADSLVATDTQRAAPGGPIALPGVATSAGSDTSFEKAAADAFREPAEDSEAGAQRLSAAAAAAAAADWLGSLQQLLPPVLHTGARSDGARVDGGTPEADVYSGKAAEATSAEVDSCSQYASLSVLDPARDVTVSKAAGARMADKLLELLSSPSGDKRSNTEASAMDAEPTGTVSTQKVNDVLGCDGAAHGGLATASPLAKVSRIETSNVEAGSSEARQRAQKEQQPSGEGHEEALDETEKEDGSTTAERRTRGGRASPLGVLPRTDSGSSVGVRDMSALGLYHPAFDLLLSPRDKLAVEGSLSESSRQGGSVAGADRSRYTGDNAPATGAAGTVPKKAEASRVGTLVDDGGNLLALRNMMRLMTATAATAPEVPAAAEVCPPAPGSARAAAGIESLAEAVREASLFASEGDASDRKAFRKKTTSPLVAPQQEQQANSMSSLMTTLANALEQHTAPLRIDARAGKSTEDTDSVTEENAQQVISLLQAVNQHFEKHQRKQATPAYSPPLLSSSVPTSSTSTGSRVATMFTGEGSPRQRLEAQPPDGVSRQTAGERLGETRSHDRQEQDSSTGREDLSGSGKCTECGWCCSERSSLCKDCISKGGGRRADQPAKRKNSCGPAALPFANAFSATFCDTISEAGDNTSAHPSTRTTRWVAEKSSSSSLRERSLRDGTTVLSGGVTGESVLPKEGSPERGLLDVVASGGGSVVGTSQKQLDLVPSRPSQHQAETRDRHLESTALHAGAVAAAAGELQIPTDLWVCCMQAMGSSLAFLRNCAHPRASESRRRVGSRRNSDTVLAGNVSSAEDSAVADSDACRPAAAGTHDEDNSSRDSLLPRRTLEAGICGVRRRGRTTGEGSVSLHSHPCSSGQRTDGTAEGATNIAVNSQAGEASGALLLRALRAYSSSTGTVAEMAPPLGETGLPKRDEERKQSTGDARSNSLGGIGGSSTGSGSSAPLRERGSVVRFPACASSWRDALPGADRRASSSAAGPGCAAAAASPGPSAASLLESTHALLQLKTHYDFMAQFVQCMMLLEVQQALVRLLQSLRRNYPSTHNSRNPSSGSVRRARLIQRRSGRKRKVSFFSSGKDSSCGSNSETGMVDKSLRSSEKFSQNRRRRRRIDTAVNRVPPEAGTPLQRGEQAVSPASPDVGEAGDLQRNSAAPCVTSEDKDHQQKTEQAADTDKDSVAAPPEPAITSVASGGEICKKDGGNSSSVPVTSTCSSSAYSSVGRQRHRQSIYRRACQVGRYDSSAGRREPSSRDTSTAGEVESRFSKSRTNSMNSSRSHSAGSRKCDEREDNVQTNSSSGSSVSGSNTNRADGLWEDEVERSRMHDSSNGRPGEAGVHGDPGVRLETFSERDAMMHSCLESLIESLRVQMRFVRVMAGHLQEHMSVAATQEDDKEGNSVRKRVKLSPHGRSSHEGDQRLSATSASAPPHRHSDVPVTSSPSSLGDSQPSTEVAVESAHAANGASEIVQQYTGKKGNDPPRGYECGDDCSSNGRSGSTSFVCTPSSSGAAFEAAQGRTRLCEENRREISAEHRTRRESSEGNPATSRDTAKDGESQCPIPEADSTHSNEKSAESDSNSASGGILGVSKRRQCEESGCETSGNEVVEFVQVSAEKRVRREAQEETGSCIPPSVGDKQMPTRTTEGQGTLKSLSEEAESTPTEGTAVPTAGDSSPAKSRERLARPAAAVEMPCAHVMAERDGGESLVGRLTCLKEADGDASSAVGNTRQGRVNIGGACERKSHNPASSLEYNPSSSSQCQDEPGQQQIVQESTDGNNESDSSGTSKLRTSRPNKRCPSSSASVSRSSSRDNGEGSNGFGTDSGCRKVVDGREGESVTDGAERVKVFASAGAATAGRHVEDAGVANAAQEGVNLGGEEGRGSPRQTSARLQEFEAGETATDVDQAD